MLKNLLLAFALVAGAIVFADTASAGEQLEMPVTAIAQSVNGDINGQTDLMFFDDDGDGRVDRFQYNGKMWEWSARHRAYVSSLPVTEKIEITSQDQNLEYNQFGTPIGTVTFDAQYTDNTPGGNPVAISGTINDCVASY